jgi:hypothetical protein
MGKQEKRGLVSNQQELPEHKQEDHYGLGIDSHPR